MPATKATPLTLLIIDDEPINLGILVEELTRRGFESFIAQDGEDGFRKARSVRPDLILLDINMPGWDGFETCRRLKSAAETRDIPVIFLSAVGETGQKVRGFQAGCVDYITKPFQPQEVLARVSAHLHHHQMFQRMAAQLQRLRDAAADESHRDETGNAPAEAQYQPGLQLVYKARDILLADLGNPPGLPELARLVGTNHSKLSSEFQHHLGLSVFAYLREQRMAKAQSLLTETELPIQRIAEIVGYNRNSDFSTAFKRHFGMTPREYRKQQLDNNP